ncbi:MAG: hypothetical protein ACE5FU_09215, partial [Nitrospinota bacterium]
MRRVRLFFLLSLLTFLSCIYTALTFYPHYFDVNYYKKPIEETLTELIGIPVSFGHIDFSFRKGLSLNVRDLKIAGATGRSGLVVEKSMFLFKLLPLLKERKFVIKSIQLLSPEILLERGQGGEIYLLESQKKPTKKGERKTPERKSLYRLFPAIAVANIDITGGLLHFTDTRKKTSVMLEKFSFHSRLDSSKSRVLLKSGFDIPSAGNPGEFRISGAVSTPSKSGASPGFKGELLVSSIAVKLFKPYFSHPLFAALPPETGLNIKALFETNFFETLSLKGSVQKNLRGPVSIRAGRSKIPKKSPLSLNFNLKKEGDAVSVRYIKLVGEGYSLTANGKVQRIFDNNPAVQIHLKSSEVNVSKVKKHVSKDLFGKEIEQFLHANIQGGLITLSGAHYSGPYNSLLKPLDVTTLNKMSLDILLKNSSVLLPPPFGQVEGMYGNVRLKKGDLFLHRARFSYKNCDFREMEISVNDLLTSKKVAASLGGDIDLSQVKHLARHLLSPSQIEKIESPSGKALLELKIAGSLDDVDSFEFEGKVDVEEGAVMYEGFPALLEHANGTIFFSESLVELDKFEWAMGSARFGVDGTVTELKSPSPGFDLWVEASLGSRGSEIFTSRVPGEFDLRGGTGHLSASFKKLEPGILVAGDLDLSDATYVYREFPEKAAGVQNKIAFSGTYENSIFLVEKARIALGKSHVDASGIIPLEKGGQPEITLSSDKIKPADLALLFFKTSAGDGGNISLSLSVTGERPFSYKKNIKAQAKLQNASFYIGKKATYFGNMNGALKFSKNRLAVEKFLFQFDGGNIEAEGFVKGFPKPDIRIDLNADKLDLNTIFPPKKEIPGEEKEKRPAKERLFGEYTGKVEVGESRYRQIEFNTVKMFLSVKKRGVLAQPFQFTGSEGPLPGRGSLCLTLK